MYDIIFELIVRAYGVIHVQDTVASAEINTIIISLVFDKSCDTMDVTFAECVKERNNIRLRIDVIQHPNVQIRCNCATRKLLYLHGEMEMIWCFQNEISSHYLVSYDKIIHFKCGYILWFVLQKNGTNIYFFPNFFKIVSYSAKRWIHWN